MAYPEAVTLSAFTVLLPVTRRWTMECVCDSLRASDIPRGRMILVLDAPGCEEWKGALHDLGFDVEVHATGNPAPPDDVAARRPRHSALRKLTQSLVPDGPLLCIEDDTLVPPDVYTRLSLAGPNATGVQLHRHGRPVPGVWGAEREFGITKIEACGHYCLLTTGTAYKSARVPDTGYIDQGHTRQIRPLVVDWGCACGHLTDKGVLTPVSQRKVGAYVHMYPPMHNAGAEHMLHAILSEMVRKGYRATVAVQQSERYRPVGFADYTLDGVRVTEDISSLGECDAIITHLDRTPEAEALTRRTGQPLVQIMHNHLRPPMVQKCDLAVYNSEWLREGHPCDAPSIVVHPPIWPDRYRVETGDAVTLINIQKAKGVDLFYELARRMPDVEFLGVRGAYGAQEDPPDLPNLTVIDTQSDIRDAYSQTRVLLMPSRYESYGRCAMEAAVSGIPCIAAPTEGLKEALGSGGTFPARLDTGVWETAIREVLADWATHSARAKLRASSLDPSHDVSRLMGAIDSLRPDRPKSGKARKLGITVEYEGRTYQAGEMVDIDTLYAMKAAGLIEGRGL